MRNKEQAFSAADQAWLASIGVAADGAIDLRAFVQEQWKEKALLVEHISGLEGAANFCESQLERKDAEIARLQGHISDLRHGLFVLWGIAAVLLIGTLVAR